MKLLKDPGFLYDLNYLFYANFNTERCIKSLVDDHKKEEYTKYLNEILRQFGEISDDLFLFYYAIQNGRCFITTYYLDPYKDHFTTDFDFKYFRNTLYNTDRLVQNIIRFYLFGLSEEELQECISSQEKLFQCIKASNHSGEVRSRLYEFFFDPTPYLRTLFTELTEKEAILSAYYKEHYETILNAQNQTTLDTLCESVKDFADLSFIKNNDNVLYTSFCLLHKYYMNLWLVKNGAIYLLGYDYLSTLNELIKSQNLQNLEDMCDALSEASRVRILKLLLEHDEITCKDLEKIFSFSGSTAYHHLTLLVKVGALNVRNRGKTIYYSLNRPHFDKMIKQLKVFSTH